ncbi:helix-turn-helix transcriptional regulator [Solimonas marina]|uniref:Response regulator transcription factor n=1 Tax=Solimonas marina TaxID=2714601 RepID=A0A969WCJ9_9GAMM|nr:LuxR C-terminal-related transcriptional regulator [Solimonas marina]NKF22350.1 response regulator transcription factor [Solimonas marina]
MEGDSHRDLDRLIEAVYAAAFDADWTSFRVESLRLICEWAHAPAGAWWTHARDGRHGEFACWPAEREIGESAFAGLDLGIGRREQVLRKADGDLFDGLALAVGHRGSHLRSVLLLERGDCDFDFDALRRAAGHLAQASSLALGQFVKRDEWLQALGRASRGSAALVDSHGVIYASSKRFVELIAAETGQSSMERLPFALPVDTLEDSASFEVGSLHFRLTRDGGLFLLNARRPHPLDVLSPREQEIARALALGKTFKSVAREYQIAISTVANHASRIYRKLGLYRREELVELLRRAVDSKAA